MKNFLLFAGFALALCLLPSPSSAASDLDETHQFYEEAEYLMELGVLNGYPDGSLKLTQPITRAQAVMMIGRLQGFDGTQADTKFTDVSKKDGASGFIKQAEREGLIKGYPDGSFKPHEPIKRGNMAMIVSKLFASPFSITDVFSDVPLDLEAAEAIGQLYGASITKGYPDGTFKPKGLVTRGHFTAFLARGLEPEFKNDAAMEHSYLRDKTKSYHYEDENGDKFVHTFTDEAEMLGEPLGFVWSINHEEGNEDYYFENETRSEYMIGYPYSEAYTDLVYPVKVGVRFNTDTDLSLSAHQITGVNKSVKTPYRTFTNAVEISVAANAQMAAYKYYMVEGFGTVKSISNDGTVLSQLIDVK